MEIFLSLAEAVMEFSQPQRLVLSFEYCGKKLRVVEVCRIKKICFKIQFKC